MRNALPFAMAALLLGAAGPLLAQEPAPPPAAVPGLGEPRLVFEREVYSYPGSARRDPFRPLTSRDDLGPLFEEFRLLMIIYDETPGNSIVVLVDAENRRHRLRRGDVLGNATVVEIGPRRVVFSVDNFGMRRQEVLEITTRTRPEAEGA